MCAKISFEFLSLLARLELSDHYIMKTRKKGSFLGLLTMPYVKESMEREGKVIENKLKGGINKCNACMY